MSRIVEAGVVVENGELFHLAEVPGVLEPDRRVVRDGGEGAEILFAERFLLGALHQLDHTEAALSIAEGRGEDRAGREEGGCVEAGGKAWVLAHVLHEEGLSP